MMRTPDLDQLCVNTIRTLSMDAVRQANALLAPMAHYLSYFMVGSIAEIFDGDAPFAPRGCPAQAWSVAETLRAWCEISAAAAARPRAPSRRRSPAGPGRGGRPS